MVPKSTQLTLACALLATSLAGCSLAPQPTYPPGREPIAQPGQGGSRGSVGDGGAAEIPDAQPRNGAATSLLEASRAASAGGDYESAAATLERAVAIEPNDARLWIELAEVRWNQGDREQADSLARKALTLAGTDRNVTGRAERLVRRR